MAQSINLLPTNYAGSKEVVQVANVLKNLAIAGAFLFIILATAGIVTVFLFTTQADSEQKKVDLLTQQIKNIQAVEQKFFLVKDRVSKASTILKNRKIEPNLANIETLASSMPQGVSLYDAEVSSSLTKLTINATESVGLATFLSNLVTNKSYTQMTLKNFSFNPNSGYFATLELK